MVQFRVRHTATILENGDVLVTGGFGPQGPSALSEIYSPSKESWSQVASMSEARAGHTATLDQNGTLIVIGGTRPGGTTATFEFYDPDENLWSYR